MKRYIAVLCAAAVMWGCALQLPPQQMPVVVPDEYIFTQKGDTTLVVGVEWWEIFGDTTLNRLILTALENNRNVRVALSKVAQAQLSLRSVRAESLPSFDVSINGEGSYQPSALTGKKAIGQQYSVLPEVSWEISLFGRLKNATAAAEAEIFASEWAYRGAMLSLAAQVAETYFEWLQYARCLEISERSFSLREQAQHKIDTMYYYGFSSRVDLEQARSLTATAAANIPSYRRAMVQTNLVLNTLIGEEPRLLMPPAAGRACGNEEQYDGLLYCGDLTAAELPAYIPAGLPSELLARRPDVREAEQTVDAAAARARVARAERFPSISLTGSGGVLAYTVKGLTAHNPFYWAAASSITQPIFAFGRLKAAEESAKEDYRQALLSYEQTMLEALSDVESALVAIETYRNESRRYITLIDANSQTQQMTEALYADGLANYLNVIDAERNLYSSQLEYITILTSQLSAYVSLYKALGGGW